MKSNADLAVQAVYRILDEYRERHVEALYPHVACALDAATAERDARIAELEGLLREALGLCQILYEDAGSTESFVYAREIMRLREAVGVVPSMEADRERAVLEGESDAEQAERAVLEGESDAE